MVRRAVQRSFNSITVDGDTSTNDTVLAYAAGEPLAAEHHSALEQGLTKAMQQLTRAIARDEEGPPCSWRVQVQGACDEAAAQAIARTIIVALRSLKQRCMGVTNRSASLLPLAAAGVPIRS